MKLNFKSHLLIIFLIGVFNLSFSQQAPKKLSKGNIELLKRFKKQRQERLNRVDSFLKANPKVKASLSTKDKTVYIYDVYDNKPIYRSTFNTDSGKATKTNNLQPGGSSGLELDGTDMYIGVWDGGPVQDTHVEFANASDTDSRVTVFDNSNVDGDGNFSSHGTHVAGTVGAKGVDTDAKGMAVNVNILSYNWSNDQSEMINAANATNPILVSNHSYGTPIDQPNGIIDAWRIGSYDSQARDIDDIARNNPKYLIVYAAGNEGNVSYEDGLFPDYDKLMSSSVAKNNLVVANANPTLVPFTGEIQSLNISTGSSQGPTDDLRIKPDIAGDGTGVYSSVPDNDYESFNGTSMASPNVAGSLVLLQEYYEQLNGEFMNSSTLKGLVCHTAVDNATEPGPDPTFGWGFLDAEASADIITDAGNNSAVLDELTLDNGDTYTFTFSAQANTKITATICWTDMPGEVVSDGALNDQTPRLKNDLDLRITNGQDTFFPWKLDYSPDNGFSNSKGDNIRDNVEKIEIDSASAGQYTLTISHKNTLVGNEGGPFDPASQDFALILTGENISLSNQEFDSASFEIWPNPTTDILHVKSSITSNLDYSIYDLKGSKLATGSIEDGQDKINIQHFTKGVYLIKLTNGNNNSMVKKIIKK